MRRRLPFVLLLAAGCCLPSAGSRASGDSSLFEQAVSAQAQGNCKEAVGVYLRIVRSSGASPSLLANLASCHAAEGDAGLAVLNYERALRLAPGDAEVRARLEQVRKEAGLLRADRPVHERLIGLLEADQWLLLSGSAFVLLALAMLAAGLAGRKRLPKVRRLGLLFLAAALLPLLPALLRYQAWQDGVVTANDAKLLLSPFAEAALVGSIRAGSLVRPGGKSHGEYVLVRDEAGRSGWLAKSSFQLIAELPAGN